MPYLDEMIALRQRGGGLNPHLCQLFNDVHQIAHGFHLSGKVTRHVMVISRYPDDARFDFSDVSPHATPRRSKTSFATFPATLMTTPMTTSVDAQTGF